MKRIVLFAAAALAFAGERDARILQFYASAGEVEKGASAIVCYGVENARAVRVAPPVEQLGLSRNRCFSITPARTTTYKLIASAANGSEISESLTVRVVPAPPRILFIDLSAAEAKLGQPFTLCYGVKNASAVRLDPLGWKLEPIEKNCRMWYPVRTLNYTLTATGAGGRKDQEKFTIKVK